MRLHHLLILGLTVATTACGAAGSNTGPTAPPAASPTAAAPAVPDPFNPAVLHDIQVEMGPRDWRALKESFRDNDYYSANVVIDGERVEQIGVRSRGQGSRSPIKPSLKLDFNHYVKGQRFHAQKSLAVKNLLQDASMLRDYLAMAVFEGMGLAPPRYSFARMSVNGEPMGVFNIVEDIEEPYLAARFGEDTGNLFNYEYGIGADIVSWYFTDRGGHPAAYVPAPFKPETNEDRLDARPLVDFVRTANDAADATFVAEISRYLDVDRFLAYVAVENAVAEHDGFIGDDGMNNFYLYQYTNSTRFVVIPWDKSSSFTDAHWPLLQNLQTNVLTRRLTADPSKMKVYRDAVARAGQSFVNERFLVPKLDQAFRLIGDAARADVKKPFDNATFENAVSGLRQVIVSREADILGQTR